MFVRSRLIGCLVCAKLLSRNKPLWKAATSKIKLTLKAELIEQENGVQTLRHKNFVFALTFS